MGFWSKLRKTLFRGSPHAEIDEEIQFHLAMRAREALDPRQARLRFGNPTAIREETRAMGIFEWLESVLQDARYGLRQLRSAPALTLSVIVSLVIGIGANTAIFSIVDAALLRPLPVRDPQSLRIIEWASPEWPAALANGNRGTVRDGPSGWRQGSSFGPLLYRALAREQSAFDSLVGFSDVGDAGVVVQGRAAEQTSLQYVSANFFHGLGVAPVLGRAFLDADDRVGQEPVVILSHRFWRSQMGGRPDVLDQTLRINNVPARIVGVAPPGFFGIRIGEWTDVYAPLASEIALEVRLGPDGPRGEDDRLWWVRQMARLKPGVDAATARQQLSALYRRLVVPEGVEIEPGKIPVLVAEPGLRGFNAARDETSRALWILLLLVGLVLLIVCANVANLLLSRTVARQRELAVRLALGAARLRVLRQQLVESLVLAAVGGALGLGLGYLLAASSHDLLRPCGALPHQSIRMFRLTSSKPRLL